MSVSDDNPLTIMNNNTQITRYPLHLTISALFIVLIVILGGVLSWQNFSKTSDIIRSSADKMYDQVATLTVISLFSGPCGTAQAGSSLLHPRARCLLPTTWRATPVISGN